MPPPLSAAETARLLSLLDAARTSDDPAARTELNAWLRTDPAARAAAARFLVDEHILAARLRQDALVSLLDGNPTAIPFPSAPTSPLPARPWLRWASAAAIAGGLFFFAALLERSHSPAAAQPALAIAVLQEQADAVWRDSPLASGDALPPGRHTLDSGIVALEFANGARLLVEGPAEFDLVDSNHVFFRSGRLTADVPPTAQGFVINTPGLRVVDLGTRFGLSLDRDGRGLVRVDKGEVELHRPDAPLRNLREGASLAFDPLGALSEPLPYSARLPSENDLRERINSADTRRALRWRAAFDRLAVDPAAILHYDFTLAAESRRTAVNQASAALPGSALALVGVHSAEGRWPGKPAVEFRSLGDRLRLRYPDPLPALTLLAWARIDRLPNQYHGLLIPADYAPGAVQWLLRADGSLRFSQVNGLASIGTNRGWDHHVVAPAISPADLGRWVLLATTYDSATGLVCHYLDGRPAGRDHFKKPLPARLGSVGIGNWPNPESGAKPRDQSRNLVGRLDEFTVLSRALTPAEIAAHYAGGRP